MESAMGGEVKSRPGQYGALPHNKSANTDPQQQEAASPQVLVVRLPLRYASARSVPAPAKFWVLRARPALQTP